MLKVKKISILLLGLTPSSKLKNFFFRRLGFEIDKTASIGISIFWNVHHFKSKKMSQVGNFNVFRDLKSIYLEEFALIGNLNWFCSNLEDIAVTEAALEMNSGSVITSRHYLDCAGGLVFMANSGLLGVRSTVMTHGLIPQTKQQSYARTVIGANTLIGSNSVVVPNTQVADDCFFGMGALVSGNNFIRNTVLKSSKSLPFKNL